MSHRWARGEAGRRVALAALAVAVAVPAPLALAATPRPTRRPFRIRPASDAAASTSAAAVTASAAAPPPPAPPPPPRRRRCRRLLLRPRRRRAEPQPRGEALGREADAAREAGAPERPRGEEAGGEEEGGGGRRTRRSDRPTRPSEAIVPASLATADDHFEWLGARADLGADARVRGAPASSAPRRRRGRWRRCRASGATMLQWRIGLAALGLSIFCAVGLTLLAGSGF